MKKFISGFLTGAMIFGTIGAMAVSYVAEPASFKVLVNGKEFNSEPPALVVNGSTYLPLRAMGNALGVPVNWNEELRQAEVGKTSTDTKVNDKVQTNDKWKISFINCETKSQIDDYTKAQDGKEFLIAYFDIENLTDEEQSISSVYSEYYVDDAKALQYPVGIVGDYLQMVAIQVAPHKKAKGCIALEAPKNWESFEFIYNEDLLKKDNENVLKFVVSK